MNFNNKYVYYKFINLKIYFPQLFTSFIITTLALPTTLALWVFLTHDVKRQDNFNNFSNAMRLFTEKDNLEANITGLKLLAQLRQKNLYVKEIDLSIQYKNLVDANLEGADLREINLKTTENLPKAKLKDAEYNEETTFPSGFDPERYNMKKKYQTQLENQNQTNQRN